MFQIEIELQYFPVPCPLFSPFQLPSLEKPSHTLSSQVYSCLFFVIIFVTHVCVCLYTHEYMHMNI